MIGSNPWRYDGRRAVVTGCASGIGRAVTIELLELGATVIGMDRQEPGEALEKYVEVDLADADSINAALPEIGAPVDSLFNCAGISGAFPPRDVLGVNFIGMRQLTEGILAQNETLRAIGGISSTGAATFEERYRLVAPLIATETAADAYQWCDDNQDLIAGDAYNLSKAAVIAYTMNRTVALAESGVRINAIGPGPTETPFLEATRRRLGQDVLDRLPKPLGRLAMPDEQARVLVFLNSDAASYVTGQNIWVDGGFVAGALTGAVDGSFLGIRPIKVP